MFSKIKDALNQLAEQHQANAQARSNLEGYKSSLVRMLANLQLEPNEIAALQAQQRSLALAPQDVRTVHREVFSDFAWHVFADGLLTAEELDAVGAVGQSLGLTWNDLPPQQLQKYHFAGLIIGIQRGHLPTIPPAQTGINLAPGEIAHAALACQLLGEQTTYKFVSETVGHTHHVPHHHHHHDITHEHTEGRSVPVTETVPIDRGNLIITNQRIVYVGARQNFNAPWPNVLSAKYFRTGVNLTFTDQTEAWRLTHASTDDADLTTALLQHYLN